MASRPTLPRGPRHSQWSLAPPLAMECSLIQASKTQASGGRPSLTRAAAGFGDQVLANGKLSIS